MKITIFALLILVVLSWFFAIIPVSKKELVGICENPMEPCPQREEIKTEFKTLKEIIINEK